jgi:hypothetical protein
MRIMLKNEISGLLNKLFHLSFLHGAEFFGLWAFLGSCHILA